MESLQLASVVAVVELAIGEHAIDVEGNQTDVRGLLEQRRGEGHQPGCAWAISSALYPTQAHTMTVPSKRVITGWDPTA